MVKYLLAVRRELAGRDNGDRYEYFEILLQYDTIIEYFTDEADFVVQALILHEIINAMTFF